MVTQVSSLTRSGVSDWVVQRVSALILLAYFAFIGYQLACGIDYAAWSGLFDRTWVRVFTLLALLSVAAHAWIGLWSVVNDYLTERLLGNTGNVLRMLVLLVAALVIFAILIWGIQILWSN